jgi:hypothetical protein
MNAFTELLAQANDRGWCVQPYCTTCGSREYRTALKEFNVTEALCQVDIENLASFRNWDDALRIALGEISGPTEMDSVLGAWLPQIHRNAELADIVLFYFVRRSVLFAPMGVEMVRAWTQACIVLACRERHESLVESLIYCLGPRVYDSMELAGVPADEPPAWWVPDEKAGITVASYRLRFSRNNRIASPCC